MKSQSVSLEHVREEIYRARSNPSFKNKFPKKLWDDIFSLVKIYSSNVVCEELNLCKYFLAKKIRKTQAVRKKEQLGENSHMARQDDTSRSLPKKPVFREIPFEPIPNHDRIVIELTQLDLKAKIEGPSSCLDSLIPLFRGK